MRLAVRSLSGLAAVSAGIAFMSTRGVEHNQPGESRVGEARRLRRIRLNRHVNRRVLTNFLYSANNLAMDTNPPNQPIDLDARAHRHLIQTLLALLPPPAEDTPEATLARDRAALASLAALAPSNANEADLAAQCVAARAQADHILRLIGLHADDAPVVAGLNAQYAAMVRISLAVLDCLLREQQRRRKREAIPGNAARDERTRRAVAAGMLQALSDTVPKTVPESQSVGNETPMVRPASPVIDLRLVQARPYLTGRQGEPAVRGSRRGHSIH